MGKIVLDYDNLTAQEKIFLSSREKTAKSIENNLRKAGFSKNQIEKE